MSAMLSTMIILAAQKHDGQTDKSGRPYILHTLTVMHKLRSDDEELNCIAVGHDLIEDTDTTYFELRNLGFSDRVTEGIRCLTKVPGETPEDYLAKILSNRDAMLVKKRDLEHNSDIRRLKGLTEKDFLRLQKYNKMYVTINEALNA